MNKNCETWNRKNVWNSNFSLVKYFSRIWPYEQWLSFLHIKNCSRKLGNIFELVIFQLFRNVERFFTCTRRILGWSFLILFNAKITESINRVMPDCLKIFPIIVRKVRFCARICVRKLSLSHTSRWACGKVSKSAKI